MQISVAVLWFLGAVFLALTAIDRKSLLMLVPALIFVAMGIMFLSGVFPTA